MELLRDVEPALEGTAALFEEAGLGAFASGLRSNIPLATLEAAFAVCHILRDAQMPFWIEMASADAGQLVSEAAFWAEGAVLAACDGEIDLFNDCLGMVKRTVASGWPRFAIH
jgi:hypothetical protein